MVNPEGVGTMGAVVVVCSRPGVVLPDVVHVRCVLCCTWWTLPAERLAHPLRCERCGAAFTAGSQPEGHPEPLPLAQPVRREVVRPSAH